MDDVSCSRLLPVEASGEAAVASGGGGGGSKAVLGLSVGVVPPLAHVQFESGSAHDVPLMQEGLLLPPQSLQVRLYHCRYSNWPLSVAGTTAVQDKSLSCVHTCCIQHHLVHHSLSGHPARSFEIWLAGICCIEASSQQQLTEFGDER